MGFMDLDDYGKYFWIGIICLGFFFLLPGMASNNQTLLAIGRRTIIAGIIAFIGLGVWEKGFELEKEVQ